MATRFLLYAPKMKALAERICGKNPGIIPMSVEWRRFPDRFPDTFIADKERLFGAHVSFLACLDEPETVFEQVSLIYDLAESSPASFRILLPYFPTGTMERKDHEGQVATASSLAQMLSAVAPAGPGPVPLFIWDIHALQIRHYFGPNIAPKFKSGMKLLKTRLAGAGTTIVFPDEGAWKRYRVLFSDADGVPEFPFVLCRKVRDGGTRKVTVAEGDVEGKDVVIVDDIIHSGGTTIECAKALMAAGARTVSAFASHAVMENGSWKKFTDAGFEKVWITDSCPETVAKVAGTAPFEVLSLDDSIARAVML